MQIQKETNTRGRLRTPVFIQRSLLLSMEHLWIVNCIAVDGGRQARDGFQ